GGEIQVLLLGSHVSHIPIKIGEYDISFPSSAWERPGRKLCFPSGRSREAGASRRAFPSGAWERGEIQALLLGSHVSHIPIKIGEYHLTCSTPPGARPARRPPTSRR